MIPSKYLTQVQSFILALAMTMIMSFAITFINLGFVDQFLDAWLRAWLIAFVIAFPVLLVMVPIVRKFAVWITAG